MGKTTSDEHRMLGILAHKEEIEKNNEIGREIEVRIGSWEPKEESILQRRNWTTVSKVLRSNKIMNRKCPVSQIAQSHLPSLPGVCQWREKERRVDCSELRSGWDGRKRL